MRAMILKEFRQMRRDRRTLALMIGLPLLLLIVFGLLRMRARPTQSERTSYIYAPRTSFIIGRLLGRSRDKS